MSATNIYRENVQDKNNKWFEGSSCPATTSRGLSPSSGDHDDSETYSFCSEKCSCCSNNRYISEFCEKPIVIVDSTTKLQKSIWLTLKNYLKRRIKLKRKKSKTGSNTKVRV